MAGATYTRIYLHERPVADITPTTFKSEQLPLSSLVPGENEVLVKVHWLSLDPAMRGWLNDKRSYVPPVKIGETMRAGGLATVIKAGPGSELKEGDVVSTRPGMRCWTEYAVVKTKDCEKLVYPKGANMLDFLGALGMPGLTAYFGLLHVGAVKAGDVLVVSGAAGAVGSLVCQIGKKKGAKVYAIAGGKEKCKWLEEEVGVEKAFDYKDPKWKEEFKKVGYLDVYFDNVGGETLDFMLTRLKVGARIPLCGAISDYNNPHPKGLSGYMNLISQRAKIEGFIVFDYAKEYPAAISEMASWLADGTLKRKFHIVEGLDNAPKALPMLFTGGNTGKLVVKVSDPVNKDAAKL
ncbi:alcohol dehydrogenase [Punctularia strigosozonata HHB-11173 SS5]|uniref:Alcohol dehydrogenase n=1 Tax=Punctularia strigosozonata (strain HHB-11173) TaxID=741275 RepID=R7S3R3_PUNST|nr:alcohol dehydrogenase [Punctularia strigosozonata HHB-11173 SS5]EIN04843.1 alcohol dehydrogenase [Punctularia strigosozonata HHB-11173 SS5]